MCTNNADNLGNDEGVAERKQCNVYFPVTGLSNRVHFIFVLNLSFSVVFIKKKKKLLPPFHQMPRHDGLKILLRAQGATY